MKSVLSIIIPVFNTGNSASDLVHYIIKNTNLNYEIILIDDGSTDDSFDVLKQIKHPKVKLYRTKNSGPSNARNFGIKKSSGKYLLFLDSDDSISSNYISSMVEAISQPKTALASAPIRYFRIKTNTTTDLFATQPLKKSSNDTKIQYILKLLARDGRLYSAVNKIFHRDLIEKHQLHFDSKLNFAEDTKFVLEYLSHASGKIKFLSDVFYIYNYGTETSIVSNSSLIWSNWLKSYQFLRSWASPLKFPKDHLLLYKIYFRWRISHSLAVARSSKPLRQKLQHLDPARLFLASLIVKFRH